MSVPSRKPKAGTSPAFVPVSGGVSRAHQPKDIESRNRSILLAAQARCRTGDEAPWMRFYPSWFLASSASISALDRGIWISLLCELNNRGGQLSYDPGRLARLCGTTKPTFVTALARLIEVGLIEHDGHFLSSRKVSEEIDYRAERTKIAKKNGSQRGKKSSENKAHPKLQLSENRGRGGGAHPEGALADNAQRSNVADGAQRGSSAKSATTDNYGSVDDEIPF